jgi:phthiodiolone/phenolphthiodiolone dimycocerosates ketoreductase
MLRFAKTFGAESVWLVDHLTGFFPESMWTPDFTWLARRSASPDAFFDWQVSAGDLAGRLGPLRLGVGVTEAVRRHPVVLAQAALSLSHLSKTPPILGIGSGEAENIVPYGLEFDHPVARLEEAAEIIRRCFRSSDPFRFDGRFFRIDDAGLALRPGRAGMPRLWIAAHGPRTLRLTGTHGDGWYPAVPMSPDAYAESLATIRAAAADAGRSDEPIVASMQVFYLVGRSDADVERQLAHPAIRSLALLAPDTSWKAAGATHPLGEGFRGAIDFIPNRYTRAEMEAAIANVSSTMLGAQLIAGTPDQVVARIRALGEAGLRHCVLSPVSPLVSRRALLFTLRSLPSMIRKLRTGEG